MGIRRLAIFLFFIFLFGCISFQSGTKSTNEETNSITNSPESNSGVLNSEDELINWLNEESKCKDILKFKIENKKLYISPTDTFISELNSLDFDEKKFEKNVECQKSCMDEKLAKDYAEYCNDLEIITKVN